MGPQELVSSLEIHSSLLARALGDQPTPHNYLMSCTVYRDIPPGVASGFRGWVEWSFSEAWPGPLQHLVSLCPCRHRSV